VRARRGQKFTGGHGGGHKAREGELTVVRPNRSVVHTKKRDKEAREEKKQEAGGKQG